MLTHTSAVEIGKPVDQVFEYVAKGYFENHHKWDAGCVSTEKTSDGPMGVGTTGREVRNERGREMRYDFHVTAFDEDKHMAFETTSGPANFSASYAFVGSDGSTTVTVQPQLQMKGLLRIFELFIGGSFRKEFDKGMAEMKRLAEA